MEYEKNKAVFRLESNFGNWILNFPIPEWGVEKVHLYLTRHHQIVGFQPDFVGGEEILNRKVNSMISSDVISRNWSRKKGKLNESDRWLTTFPMEYPLKPGLSGQNGAAAYPHIHTGRPWKLPMTLIFKSGDRILQMDFDK